MPFADRTLTCGDCGAQFTFTSGEQEFYATKGFQNDPKRCPSCRTARRGERGGSGAGTGARTKYPAVCAECGATTEVPFQPRTGKPVYCDTCFSKTRAIR